MPRVRKSAKPVMPGCVGHDCKRCREVRVRLENIEGLLRGSEQPVSALVLQNALEALDFMRGIERHNVGGVTIRVGGDVHREGTSR